MLDNTIMGVNKMKVLKRVIRRLVYACAYATIFGSKRTLGEKVIETHLVDHWFNNKR